MLVDKIQRVQELTKELNQYRHEYYNLNRPSVDDPTYDLKFDELQSLEQETGFTLANSPTNTVGYEVISKLKKVEHPIPLKSLDKTKLIDKLNDWRKGKEVVLMLKADGLTVELLYENGELVQSSTRGNAFIGEDISHNAKVFKNVPLSIPFKGILRVGGEAIIHWYDFNEINSKLPDEDKYATPRNLSAGSVRQLSSKICSERNVYFYAFNILECSEELSNSKYENFKWLTKQGFTVVLNTKTNQNIDEKIVDNFKVMAETDGIPIDGMVISFDSVNYSNSLSETSHHPLHSISLKFHDNTEESILRKVEWKTTRTGQVNPTAVFDTVILDNTEVSRASLFNLTFIKEMQLNLLNRIEVSKRNMIIPYIEENLDKNTGNYIPIPKYCPVCAGKTEIRNTGTAEFLFCTNEDCSAKLIDKFVHFVERDAVNIDGLSSASLELFINEGFLKTFDDLYNLEKYDYKIKKLEGWGSRSYKKLIEAIDKSRKVKCANFIYALGIPNVGKSSSKAIAKYFNNNFQEFTSACQNKFDFSVLTDFGDITSQSIHNWYQDNNEKSLWIGLVDEIEFIQEEKKEVVNVDSFLSGKKCYCTGTFESYKKEELKNIVQSLGGEFANGFNKSLDFLVVGKLKSSSKVQKALDAGIKVLQEDEFLEMIGRR
jgi:DNA ligase (NAD+)